MQHRVTLKSDDGGLDRFICEDKPDVVAETAGGRRVLRCLVSGRIVRRALDSIARIEAIDEVTGGWIEIPLPELRGTTKANAQTEAEQGARPAPKGDTPGGLPTRKADLLALWDERHPGVEPPENEHGNVTVASLTGALSAE